MNASDATAMATTRRDGYTSEGERATSTSASMTGHVLKDDHAMCIGTEMKLVLMNRARARQVHEKG